MFAGACSGVWVASGLISGAFTVAATLTPEAATSNAARTCLWCACLCVAGECSTVALRWWLDPVATLTGPTLAQLEGFIGLNLAMVAWRRAYAELFSL